MIIRKIKPEELKRTQELFSIAFENELDNSMSEEQIYNQIVSSPKNREEFYWRERWAAFDEDDKTMMSFFVAKPMPIHFDGNHCTMTGIGGVSSLPQYRRKGGIKACFQAALPDMYHNGIAFSYLYPFSTAYYRKFGYEMCCERMRYHIRLNKIPSFPIEGNCDLVESGHTMLDEIKSIYQVWQNRYNMMVENEDYEYAWVKNSNPIKDQIFTYVYKSNTGIPKGFMTYSTISEASERNIKCSRFFYTDLEGLQGLLNLAGSLASDHRYITFELPIDQIITPLFPECSLGALSCEKVFCGMARVINVIQVLKMARYRGSGELVLEITDSYIPENNNCFLVRFDNKTATEVSTTDTSPDITLTINDFSRLIIGVYDSNVIECMQSVKVNTALEKISKVFYQKPNLLTEYF